MSKKIRIFSTWQKIVLSLLAGGAAVASIFWSLFFNKYVLLATAIAAYSFSDRLLGVTPLTLKTAAIEVSTWDTEARIAVFSSLLTVGGFLLAFMTAHWSIVATTRRQLRMAAQDEIREFFDSAHKELLVLSSAAEQMIDLQLLLRGRCNLHDVYLGMDVLRNNYEKTLAARDSLQSRLLMLPSLRVKHQPLFSAWPTTGLLFDFASKRLSSACRGIIFPLADPKYPRHLNLYYLLTCNARRWRYFVSNVEREGLAMLGASGGVTGVLGSGVLPISPFSWLFTARDIWRSLKEKS